MSWETPTPSPSTSASPTVGWERPKTTPGFGVLELIRGGWAAYRAASGSLLRIAVLPEILRGILLTPVAFLTATMIEGMVRLFGEFDVDHYLADPVAYQSTFQAGIEAATRPPANLAFLTGVVSGAALTLTLLSLGLLTAGALVVLDGRRPSIIGSMRAVAACADGLVAPAIVLGMGWAVIATPLELSQSDVAFRASGGSTTADGSLALLSLVISVAAFVVAVRWSLAIPAMLAEGLGLRAALARSTALTAGVRMPIALALIVASVTIGLAVSVTGLVGALVGFGLSGTIPAGVLAYLVVVTVVGLFFAPIIPAMLARAYRLRIAPAPQAPSGVATA